MQGLLTQKGDREMAARVEEMMQSVVGRLGGDFGSLPCDI